MKRKLSATKAAVLMASVLALAMASPAQTVTNPCPNRVISWNLDNYSTINPTDLAGVAPATNWVDTWLNNVTAGLPDNTGAATSLNISYSSYNTWHVQGSHPGYDANGTANKEVLNGYLNSGAAAWSPWTTNTSVSLTNIPYAKYDVIVYFNSDSSGRHGSIDNGATTFYFSTEGSASINGQNALLVPTTSTTNASFPTADFAFFPGMTTNAATLLEQPESGNDQWLGIAAFQIIECSNNYVVYGPSPATQIVPAGRSASFSVIAGGLNPTYQWRHAGTNLLNTTNATYTIPATVAGQDGNYDVIISNSYGAVTSAVATLTFYTPKTVEWDGNGSTWDAGSLFWTLDGGITTTNYTETDNVRFGPLGAAQSYVSLAGTFIPSSVTISNATYTLASGGLSGSGSVRVRNNGTLVIDTPSTLTGSILIDSGSTLQLDNGDTAGSLGSGALTNNGALVFNAGGDEAYGYPIYGGGSITNMGSAGTITLGNNVSANYLVQAGGGNLLLQGSNTLAGGLVVSGGYVWARAANCLGIAPVTLTGGELQLNFTLDFPAGNLMLAGGVLHGGIGGANTYEGQVSLAMDASIQADGGGLTLANSAGVNGGNYNLTKTGNGTLFLNGNSNSWNSLTISVGTVAFNSAANLSVTSSITGGGNLSQTGSGTLTLAGDLSTFSGTVTVSAGTLAGSFTNAGPGSIVAPGTLAPGSASAVGTDVFNGGLTIGGNLAVKVNKSPVPSNDFISVPGGVSNTNNGVVMVKNLGPALVVGDKFTLFDQPVSGGNTLAVLGGSVIWTNNLAVDGSISVLSTSVPRPVIQQTAVNAGSFVFSGANGYPGAAYAVLGATNLTAGNWIVVATGTFDGSGAFAVTNVVGAAMPQMFYRLEQ